MLVRCFTKKNQDPIDNAESSGRALYPALASVAKTLIMT